MHRSNSVNNVHHGRDVSNATYSINRKRDIYLINGNDVSIHSQPLNCRSDRKDGIKRVCSI